MSFIRSAGCFHFSLLSMFMVLYVSAASRFRCVAILHLYFSEYLLISSLTVRISRSLRMSSFLTYHGAFTIVLRILACIISILFIWLIAAVPHSGIPYVQIGGIPYALYIIRNGVTHWCIKCWKYKFYNLVNRSVILQQPPLLS